MQKSAQPELSSALLWGIAGVAAITVWRVAMLWASTADLFVDEAQYWLWGQHIEAGYYSKPPLIGWVLGAVTGVLGSDAPPIIRLPGPVFHAAAALALMAATREVAEDEAAAATGLAYLSMPAATLGSFLISTDTIMLPFFALAVLCYLRLCRTPAIGWAIGLGVCLGLGMLAKYAAIYFVLGAGLAAVFLPPARIRPAHAGMAALAFLIVFSPNIIWNLQNGLTTVSHTADNIDWVNDPSQRAGLNPGGAAEFFFAQFGVMGPVFFGAYLFAILRIRRDAPWTQKWLIWMSLPVLLLVTTQGLLSRAYANWAMPAHVTALMLAVPLIWARARWLYWVGLALNLTLAVAVPLATTQATTLRLPGDDRLALRRFTGRAEVSARVLQIAEDTGARAIVAAQRDVLADLFYATHDGQIPVYARPVAGKAPHYFAQRFSFPEGQMGPVLYIGLNETAPPDCLPETATPVDAWQANDGYYDGDRIEAFLVPATCWQSGGAE